MTADRSNRNLNCKKWEKERRGRLNESFNKLAKQLPCYDPSVTMSKIEILTKSVDYITKLKLKIDECLTNDLENKPERAEIKELRTRLTNLKTRNEQLANLLKEANIRIPSECGPLHIEKAKKWSGKITPAKADEINKLEAQKENKNIEENLQNKKDCDKVRPPRIVKCNRKKVKTRRKPKKSTKVPILSTLPSIIGTTVTGTSNLTITNVQPVHPYYIIANNIPTTVTSQATTVVKNVISAPILSTTNQPNKTFPSGIILPVFQPQTLLNQPLLLNATTPGNTLFVVKPNKTESSTKLTTTVQSIKTNKKLLKPKRRLVTKLVQGNKVAISASRYDSSFILWPSLPQPIVKKRTKVVKRKRKAPEKNNEENQLELRKKPTLQILQENEKQIVPTPREEDTAKKTNSDYSIDTLCKETDAVKSNKDIDKAIDDDVQGKSDEKKILPVGERQVVNPPLPPAAAAPEVSVPQKSQDKPAADEHKLTNLQDVLQLQQQIQTNQLHFQQNQNQTKKEKVQGIQHVIVHTKQQNLPPVLPSSQNQLTSLQNRGQPVISESPLTEQIKTKSHCHKTNHHRQQLHNNRLESNYHPSPLSQSQQQSIHNQQIQVQQENHQPRHVHQQNTPQTIQIHSELSNDIFASLQVQGSQNPESTSPTAAFLNAFPLVSSFTGVKVTEVMEDETTDSPQGTPTLLQIGNLEATAKQTHNTHTQNTGTADNLTASILNLDNFNFFGNNLYQNFDSIVATATTSIITLTQPITTTLTTATKPSKDVNVINKTPKVLYEHIGQSTTNTGVAVGHTHGHPSTNMKSYRSATESSNVADKRHLQGKPATSTASNKQFTYNSHSHATITNTTTQQQPVYDNNHLINTSASSRAVVSSGINFNSTNRYNEYNTFNPFELPKTTQSFVKHYHEPAPAYTGTNSNCNYNYQTTGTDYAYQLGKNNYYEGNNCNFYNTANSTGTPASNINSQSTNNNNANKKAKDSSKTMVNWMAPDFLSSTSSLHVSAPGTGIAKVTSYSDFGQNNYLNSNALYSTDYQNTTNPTTAMDQEHQFPWSPTKLPQLLDPMATHNFPPSTLPTLVGDLALGISTYSSSNQMFDKKAKPYKKQAPSTCEPPGHASGNFLSVSQLVEHNKDASQSQPQSRITNRRNSGGAGGTTRSSKSQSTHSKNVTSKRHKDKDNAKNGKMYELDWDAKRNKNPISNYSAESLIGAKHQQNYPKAIPPYLPDNLLPYFPPNIDENFTQNTQNYHQTNSFSTNYNNTFIPPPTSTTYLPTSNFMPDMFDNPIENIFSHSNSTKTINPSTNKKSPQKPVKDNQYLLSGSSATTTPSKAKSKKKDTLVDLSFLSMPSMNSPLLPDDFHTNFLPPPPNPNQLYSSCKNPLYKQTGSDLGILPLPTGTGGTSGAANRTISGMQHTEISPAPSSLTNFNLCTIFPEINRTTSVVPDMFRNVNNNSSSQSKTTNYLPNLE